MKSVPGLAAFMAQEVSKFNVRTRHSARYARLIFQDSKEQTVKIVDLKKTPLGVEKIVQVLRDHGFEKSSEELAKFEAKAEEERKIMNRYQKEQMARRARIRGQGRHAR